MNERDIAFLFGIGLLISTLSVGSGIRIYYDNQLIPQLILTIGLTGVVVYLGIKYILFALSLPLLKD